MADNENSAGESLTTLIGSIPSIAAATSFMVLVLAFVHEWAFYYVIGSKYQSLVSITDYFNSAIGWLPWAALGFISALLWTLADPTRTIPVAIKDQYYREHRVRWFFDKAPLQFLLWSLVLAGAFQLLFGDWYVRAALEFLFIFLWLKAVGAIVRQKANAEMLSKELAYIVAFAPIFLISAFAGGWAEGASALSPKIEANAVGRLKKEYLEREWFVMRSLSGGLLLRDLADRDKLQYVRWDDVAAFETKIVPLNRNGLVCRITGRGCVPASRA